MTIIEELEEKSVGIVHIDDIRDYFRELIKEKFKDSYDVNDCFLFITECNLFRLLSYQELKSLEKKDILLMLTLIEDSEDFRECIKECYEKKMLFTLWNCIYNYLDFECFQIDNSDLKKMKKKSIYLSKVIEHYEFIESNDLPEITIENFSEFQLKLAIGEFLEYRFADELK